MAAAEGGRASSRAERQQAAARRAASKPALWATISTASPTASSVSRVAWRVILVDLSKLKSCGHLRAGAEADEVAASTD